MTDILALRWTGENLAAVEAHISGTNIVVTQDGDNLYLSEGGWRIPVLPGEFVIVEDSEVTVMSENDMLANFDVSWLD